MEPSKSITRKLLSYGFAAFLTAVVSSVGANADESVKVAGNVTYVSGGVGTESIDQLNAISGDFNLKLVFALSSGEYVSGTRVVVADTQGNALLDTISEGPWFLAKLPRGNYRIIATLADKQLTRRISVGPGKIRTVDFRWVSEK